MIHMHTFLKVETVSTSKMSDGSNEQTQPPNVRSFSCRFYRYKGKIKTPPAFSDKPRSLTSKRAVDC